MTATLRQVREAMQTRLAVIAGSPSYVINLSGTDAIKIGRQPAPWKTPPCAFLYLANEQAENGPTLPGRTRRPKFGLGVWLQATGMDPEAVEDMVEDAYEDIRRAFRSATGRTLGGLSVDVEVSLDDVAGPEETNTGAWLILCGLRVQFDEVRP